MMAQRRRMLMQMASITTMGVAHNTASLSPTLTRLGAAVGKNAVAGIGSTPQVSDFDSMPIYRDIKVCNLAPNGTVNAYEGDPGFRRDGTNGDVMVEIPAFYYKIVSGTVEERWIADGPAMGFAKHPTFARGVPYADLAKIYVPAYETSAGHVSKSGATPLGNITRPQARTGAVAKGTGWALLDVAAVMAINLLIYIEYATLDLQTAVGPGRVTGGTVLSTGGTDGMAGHTGRAAGTANAVAMKWRHIENWWGDAWTWVDGLNINSGAYYLCLNPANFADDTINNYTAAGFTVPTSYSAWSYVVAMGLNTDYPWFRLPTVGGGSATTYYCDAILTGAGWRAAYFGGDANNGTVCGPASWVMSNPSTRTDPTLGCRLMYLPQSA